MSFRHLAVLRKPLYSPGPEIVLGPSVRPVPGLRRRITAGLTATLVVMLAWVLVELQGGDPPTTVVHSDPPFTAPSPTSEPASPPASSGTRPTPGSTAVPVPTPAHPTQAAPCRNSTDPRCGAFSWDLTPAANQPLVIALEVSPARPRVGEEVVVHVTATDPDAPVTTNGGSYFFHDPYDHEPQIGFASTVEAAPERFGPWTPPEPQPGHLELSFAHTFSQPGTFRFSFTALSGDEADPGNQERNPYANAAHSSVDITVAPSTSPAGAAP